MSKGQLKSWDDTKGFGFIKSDEFERDVFIHISTLKAMSRNPKVGDFIYFEIEYQHNGKTRAKNCRIEGVAPIKMTHKKHFNQKKSSIGVRAIATFIIALGVFSYANTTRKVEADTPFQVNEFPIQIKQSQNFRCDGRQYCSQMNSRAEAEFFNLHCPNTKMDGDHDGKPCESDSRF